MAYMSTGIQQKYYAVYLFTRFIKRQIKYVFMNEYYASIAAQTLSFITNKQSSNFM